MNGHRNRNENGHVVAAHNHLNGLTHVAKVAKHATDLNSNYQRQNGHDDKFFSEHNHSINGRNNIAGFSNHMQLHKFVHSNGTTATITNGGDQSMNLWQLKSAGKSLR